MLLSTPPMKIVPPLQSPPLVLMLYFSGRIDPFPINLLKNDDLFSLQSHSHPPPPSLTTIFTSLYLFLLKLLHHLTSYSLGDLPLFPLNLFSNSLLYLSTNSIFPRKNTGMLSLSLRATSIFTKISCTCSSN